ncbi:MAG: hypothetical protein Q9160_005432 [Pyrenula sp. 1 TL-2023]
MCQRSGMIEVSVMTDHNPTGGGSILTPSTITWLTCTPLGPNSRASDWASAFKANFPDAKDEKFADPLTDAVAPVKISVGG